MNSEILKLGAKSIKYLFLVVSVWILLRGHNQPGGGFIGGLIAGSGLIFIPLVYEIEKLKGKARVQSALFLKTGMSCVLLSAIAGIVFGDAILDGLWIKINLPVTNNPLKLGTPLLFDIGVYFTVIGFLFFIVTSMMEEWQWKR